MDIRIAGLEADSISNGNGFRFVLYVQGCIHACPGCQNPQTHDIDGGVLTTTENVIVAMSKMITGLTKGITISGGEPFLQPEACAEIAKYVHTIKSSAVYPEDKHFDVWTYTGYTYEELNRDSFATNPFVAKLLQETDYLVEGPYIQKLRDINLQFRGSSNQRILHLVNGLVVL